MSYLDNSGLARFFAGLKNIFATKDAVTTSANGLMSAADKTKLDGIDTNANAYTLPTAGTDAKGGVKIGSGLTMTGEILSADSQTENDYTTAEKTKLAGIEAGAQANPPVVSKTANGLAPQLPDETSTTKFLRQDGTWNVPPGTYVLPTAGASTKGGVQVGSGLTMTGDVLSADVQSTNDYTTAEKSKLAGIDAGANAYTLPAATSSSLGGVMVGTNLSIADGVLSATDTTYGVATSSASGLMSAEDKAKLDSISGGGGVSYTLPPATTSTLGGVIVGSNLSVDANGVLSASAGNMSASVIDLQINVQDNPSIWQTGQNWPSGANTKPLGESDFTCDLVALTTDANGDSIVCADGDDFKVGEYSQARCPAPLWIYVGTNTIYVATRLGKAPTENITIRGLILHR